MSPLKRLFSILVAVLTAVANWYIFCWLAGVLKLSNPEFLANILLLSVIVHEIGHWIVLETSGIPTHLIFLVVLGGAVPDPKYKAALNSLDWSNKALIYMAGVSMNVLLMVIVLVMYLMDNISSVQTQQIVNLNGILIFFNVLPIGIFDGGRFAKVLFDSIPEDLDIKFTFKILLPVYAVVILLLIVVGRFDFVSLSLLLWGLQFQANHDDPEGSSNKLAMTKNQYGNWTLVYIGFLIVGLIAEATTKNWILLK